MAASGIWACSASQTSDSNANDGGVAGSANGGGIAGSANGGAPVASAGGPQGNAGLAGAGSSASVAGSSGDTSGTASCAVWPRSRLLPIIGPFFYGKDPGPCINNNGSTFSYEAGRLLSSTDAKGLKTTYQYDAQGIPTGSTSSDGTSEAFEFGADYVLDTSKYADGSINAQYRYTLSPSGYPTAVTIDVPNLPSRFGTYSYSNCRLLARTVALVGAAPEKLTYEYDDTGHLTKRACDCGDAAAYDYSCWK